MWKSSFLNTVFASFNDDKWREIARTGRFSNNRQVTRLFKSYEKELYYKGDDNALMPIFLDLTGLENDDSMRNLLLLKIILSGKVKENECIADIIRDIAIGDPIRRFIAELKYQRRSVHRRIDRIIVVSSYNLESNLPSTLLDSVSICAAEKDIKVFGVLTHADQLVTENINRTIIQERERKFKELLGIPDTRFARITNYNSGMDRDRSFEEHVDPTIDVPVLTLMRQVLLRESHDDKERLQDPNMFSYISLEKLLAIVFIGMVISGLIGSQVLLSYLLIVIFAAYLYYEYCRRTHNYLLTISASYG